MLPAGEWSLGRGREAIEYTDCDPWVIVKVHKKIAKRPFVLGQKYFEATERHKQKNLFRWE